MSAAGHTDVRQLIQECRDVLRNLHEERQRAADGLTVRQREILELYAQGLRGHQVADRLCISPRTLSQHHSAIATKLALPGRSAIALTMAAMRRGLIPCACERS